MKYPIVDDYIRHLRQTWVTLNDLPSGRGSHILMQINQVMYKVSNTSKE